MKYLAILSILILTGCASIVEGQRKAADVAFGEATGECRVVRAQALTDAAKEQWPDLTWTAVDRAMLRLEASENFDLVISEYSAAMITTLMPVFVELGRSVIGTIEQGQANGWTLDGLVAPLMQINGVPQRLITVRAKVAECEAS